MRSMMALPWFDSVEGGGMVVVGGEGHFRVWTQDW